MKVHVLFNDAGEVGAIFHPKTQKGGFESRACVGFRPREGQHTAILDVPHELEGLKPRALHEAVQVETRGGSYRLKVKA
jgi:hypothetical protein